MAGEGFARYDAVSGDQEPEWIALAAKAAVLDPEAFEMCLTSERAQARLDEDAMLVEHLGVSGTPTYVHRDGVVVGGGRDVTEFERILRGDG